LPALQLTKLVFDRAVGHKVTSLNQVGLWGPESGEDYGTAGESFDGDGAGPNHESEIRYHT